MAVSDLCLVVHVNGVRVGLSSEWVLELLQQTRVQRTWIPGTQRPFSGTMHYRERHIAILDLRALLGFKTFEEQLADLRATLEAREQDHIAWLNELRKCCEDGREFTKAIDPHKCAFGKWYDALCDSDSAMQELCGNDQYLKLIVSQFDAPHQAIHGIAERALSLAAAGDLPGATAVIKQTWGTELAKMQGLFTKLIDGVAANRNAIFVVVQADECMATLIVDDVHTLIEVDREEVQATSIENDGFSGVYASDALGEVLMMDLPRVFARLSESVTAAA